MAEQVHTLVVDDEEGIRFFLQETLQQAGHQVVTAASGEEALDKLRDTVFDLVMLDLRLGGRVDGLRVLETVKWRWPKTAVVILTAHGSLDSALVAIREGVDGYLLKPAEPADIRQVVREILSRQQRSVEPEQAAPQQDCLQCGVLVVDRARHTVTLDAQPLELTPREFRLLVHLMENVHRVVSPQELVQVVQGYECEDVREAREVIKWYIHRLRRKLELDLTDPQYIVNVRGVGYMFSHEG
jgi:two-component system alkaline phosphatase synthesis response regulator PhoP